MKSISQPMLIFLASIALALIIVVVSVGFLQSPTPNREKIYVESIPLGFGGKEINDYVRISDMKPNSMAWFNYPDTKNTQNRDAYQKFILIRLAKDFGGAKNDTSAFRAYSALDLESHCVIKYWPQEGRQRIEDPCHIGMYRAQDGLGVFLHPLAGPFNALPYLELSSDDQGYLYANPPVWAMDKNGVPGIGRAVTADDYKKAAESDLNDYLRSTGKNLDIPRQLRDGSFLTPGFEKNWFFYKNANNPRNVYDFKIEYCDCKDDDPFVGVYNHHVWNLGDDVLFSNGDNSDDASYHYNTIVFYRDGYKLAFSAPETLEKTLSPVLDNFYKEKNISMLEKIV